MFTFLGDEDPSVLCSFTFNLTIVEQGILDIEIIEQLMLILQHASKANDFGQFVLSLTYLELADNALARFNQVKSFGHFAFFLQVVSIRKINLLHIDSYGH